MKRILTASIALASTFMLVGTVANAAVISNFDSPADTAGWTVDRFAPATFQSGVAYGGHAGTLSEATSAADGQATTFYDTQGRALNLPVGTTAMSIQLYNDPLYATDGNTDERIAGFWGVADDNTNQISAYPIIELDKIAGNLVLRDWDSNGLGSWNTMSVGPGVGGNWDTLGIAVVGTNVNYYVNGQLGGSVDSGGSVSLNSVILQVYNTPTGVNDSAHWDNLVAGSTLGAAGVPEPASWALMITGFGAAGAMLRRRRVVPT